MSPAAEYFRRLSALFLSLAIALTGPFGSLAAAQEAPKVALLPTVSIRGEVSQATAEKITDLLARALKKQDGIEPVALAAPAKPPPAPEPAAPATDASAFQSTGDAGLAAARTALASAKKEMDHLRFDRAAALWHTGIAGLEGAFDRLSDFQVLTDAYLQLAICELRANHRSEGEKALATVVTLSPDQKLAGGYPAIFVRMFEQVRKQMAAEGRGTLSIGGATGAAVMVDGRAVGQAPASLDVPPGQHFILVGGEGARAAYVTAVATGATAQVGQREVLHKGHPNVASKPEGSPLMRIRAEVAQNSVDAAGTGALSQLAGDSGATAILITGIHYTDDARSQIGVDALIFNQDTQEIAALTRVVLDAEVSAGPAVFSKLCAEMTDKLANWSDVVSLPVQVAPDLKAPRPPAAAVGMNEARRDDTQDLVVANHGKPVEAAQENAELGPPQEVVKSGGFPWLPVGLGVGLGAVAIVGGILLYGALTAKPGFTPQLTW